MKEMNLSHRMKFYENHNKQYLSPNQYVLMRLDGKNFSKFTKKYFDKPFDDNFYEFMKYTMEYLFNNISGCVAGYVQSDEITLLLTDMKSVGMEGWFNYRVDKMCSIAAGMATAKFNNHLTQYLLVDSDYDNFYCNDNVIYDLNKIISKFPLPVFDCRVWNVPNENEVKNVFLWRQRDCIRNSVLQYAQSFFSHKELMNKNIDECKEMIKNKSDKYNIPWEDLDDYTKYGTFIFKEMNENGRTTNHLISDLFKSIEYKFDEIFNNVVKY